MLEKWMNFGLEGLKEEKKERKKVVKNYKVLRL